MLRKMRSERSEWPHIELAITNPLKLVHADPLAALGVGLGSTGGTPVPPKPRQKHRRDACDTKAKTEAQLGLLCHLPKSQEHEGEAKHKRDDTGPFNQTGEDVHRTLNGSGLLWLAGNPAQCRVTN